MKQICLILLFLVIGSIAHSQKNLLITTILLEGKNTPAQDVEVRIHDQDDNRLTTLTTNEKGKISYRTDQSTLNLDIRSRDLHFKSSIRQSQLVQNDTTLEFYVLSKRSNEEVEQLQSSLRKLNKVEESNLTGFCPNFISGVEDTANFKTVYTCLVNNIRYPDEAHQSDIEGKIYVRFVINENGEIRDLRIVNVSYAVLEEEALRATACLSGMTPATCDGKKVPTTYMLPLNFKLD